MKYYITYGYNTKQRNCYSVIEDSDYDSARANVNKQIGNTWAFMYAETSKRHCIDRFDLTEIPLQTPTPRTN